MVVILYKLWQILLLSLLFFTAYIHGHSLDNKKLDHIEPLVNFKVDIAPRPDAMFMKRDMSATSNSFNDTTLHNIKHDDILRLQFQAYNQTFTLHLEPNTDLLHSQAVFMYDGKPEPVHPHTFRIYRGHVIHPLASHRRWQHDQLGLLDYNNDSNNNNNNDDDIQLGWARLIVRDDLTPIDSNTPIFEGSFQMLNDIYHIKSVNMYHRTKRSDDVTLATSNNIHLTTPMVLYRDSDTSLVTHTPSVPSRSPLQHRSSSSSSPSTCGVNATQPLLRSSHPASGVNGLFFPPSLTKRADAGCPTTRKIAYMGAAADCTYTKYYQSRRLAQLQILSDWNSVSALYEQQFNIQLGLVNITVMDEFCPTAPTSDHAWNRACSDNYTMDDRLSDFSRWRGRMSEDGIALWHLLTNCPTGAEVGIAWTSNVCVTEATSQSSSTGKTQYVTGAGVSSIIRDEWKVIAHEIGHGFGANHDCNAADCPCRGSSCTCCPLNASVCDAGGSYIMNPTSNISAQAFSPCSVSMICSNIPSLGHCLEVPGNRTVEKLQMCGNGIVEEGEECDPGSQSSSCCDAATCKFVNNAVCDDVNDSCCNQCSYRPSDYECRPASSTTCDVPEYCTGSSGTCPPDLYRDDGTSCGIGLQCASGQCTSRDLQCKNRGSLMNITKACSASNSCTLSCSNGSGRCSAFSGSYINGTPCGSNGMCRNGDCDEGSLADRARYWLSTHQNIVIPVGVVIGVLIVGSLGWCCYAGCCGRGGWRNRKKHKKHMVSSSSTSSSPTAMMMPHPPPIRASISSSSRHIGNNRVSSPPSSKPASPMMTPSMHPSASERFSALPASPPPPPPVHQHQPSL